MGVTKQSNAVTSNGVTRKRVMAKLFHRLKKNNKKNKEKTSNVDWDERSQGYLRATEKYQRFSHLLHRIDLFTEDRYTSN